MLRALPTIAIFLLMLIFNILTMPVDLVIRFLKVLTGNDEE